MDVYVGVSNERRTALAAAKATVPPYVRLRMIVDTGATATVVDEAAIKPLGLSPTGLTPIHTPSTGGTPATCATYDISLALYHVTQPLILGTIPVIASDFSSQGIHGLIGCDVLRRCLFVYDGVAGSFTLAF
jgi:hypothetical protein